MPVTRYDRGTIGSPTITPQGYLKADVFLTRAGVFNYLRADGTIRRELRHPNEVFRQESMKSLAELIVTNDHPPVRLDASNTKQYSVGFLGPEVERAGDYLKGRATVTDAATIEMIQKGEKREASCGYECDMDETPGVWNGQPYDAAQKNIFYNHAATVRRGRAGPGASFKLDSEDAVMVEDEKSCEEKKDGAYSSGTSEPEGEKTTEQEISMPEKTAKIKIDSIEFEASEPLAQAVSVKLDALKSANEATAAAKTEAETLKGKNDALEAELVKKNKEIEEVKASALTDAQIVARADELSKVIGFSKKVLGEDFSTEGKGVGDIKRAVVEATLGAAAKERSDAYVDGVFDTMVKKDSDSAGDSLKGALGASAKADAAPISSDDVRAKSMQADANAWKVKA